MLSIGRLDPYETAPSHIKQLYKRYQRLSSHDLDDDGALLDFRRGLSPAQKDTVQEVSSIAQSTVRTACRWLSSADHSETDALSDVKVYEVKAVPGLRLIPHLLSQRAQEDLLSHLLHDNLANQNHKTNVHLHHHIPYYATLLETCGATKSRQSENASFFHLPPDSHELFKPLDAVVHKPFTVSQFLSRKLRWLTLGGQFDWTGKRYPLEEEPPFPEELGKFIHRLFPFMKPEAAIVNIYRPGDVLSVHRDVSEESDNALVSLSLGCQGILVVGLQGADGEPPKTAAIRLYSGDAVCLSGPARFAWHGVPQVLQGTSPNWLQDWPAKTTAMEPEENQTRSYEAWRGWMSNKRVNLSVRQIRD